MKLNDKKYKTKNQKQQILKALVKSYNLRKKVLKRNKMKSIYKYFNINFNWLEF